MIRIATEEDLPRLVEICNQHERSINPESEDVSQDEIRQNLLGWQEPAHSVVHLNQNQEIDGVCFITPDTPRSRCEFDVYSVAGKVVSQALTEYSVEWWKQNAANFELRTACNKEDLELCEIFQSQGFYLKRIYWKLAKEIHNESFPVLPAGVTIRTASWPEDAELIHELEMESFSEHFAFIRLSFADWFAQNERDELRDLSGYFLLLLNGKPVGYSLASNSRINLNGGYVDKLGVLEAYRGRGFGKILLQQQFAYAAERGFSSVALGVDSENESGALKLYFGLGFKPSVAWASYCQEPAH